MFGIGINQIIILAFLILNVLLIVRFFRMSSDLKQMKSILNDYYGRDFSNKVKEKKLNNYKHLSSLPVEIKCVHCDKELDLKVNERESKIFICPHCSKENDLN